MTIIRALLCSFMFGAAILPATAQQPTPDALAQARSYEAGQGVPRDPYTAFDLYAGSETAEGFENAARMKLSGLVPNDEVASDNAFALYLYEQCAELGRVTCMTSAARLYEAPPVGIEQSLSQATHLYRKAYEAGATKSDAEYANIARVSAQAFERAEMLRDQGEHWDAYHEFETLCDLKVPAACYWLGKYRGAANSPYGYDPAAALRPLAFACDLSVPGACADHAGLTVFVGPTAAGADHGRRAERTLRGLCDAATPDYEACFRVSVLHYFTGYGLGDWKTMKSYTTKSCLQGSIDAACSAMVDLINRETAPARAAMGAAGSRPGGSSGGNWGRSVDNAVGGFFAALLSGSAEYAATGNVGASSSYSRSSSYTPSNNVSTWQANRDWNNALRSTASIGTAYRSSCRPGNPYC